MLEEELVEVLRRTFPFDQFEDVKRGARGADVLQIVRNPIGKLCEIGSPDLLYAQPAHPYTAALLSAIPEPDPERHDEEPSLLQGEIPSNTNPPSGCRFRTRCPRAEARCEAEEPVVRQVALGQFVACHFPLAPGESLETGDVLAEFDLA